MCASSHTYPDAKTYRRTAALIDHGHGQSYVIDLFEVTGGSMQDYIYHGPGELHELRGFKPTSTYDQIYDLDPVWRYKDKRASGARQAAPWRASFRAGGDLRLVVWNLPQLGETVYVGRGWGQRDHGNKDRGLTVPYVVRRCEGEVPRTFISVFEGAAPGQELVRDARVDAESEAEIVVKVDTTDGADYVGLRGSKPGMEQSDSGTVRCTTVQSDLEEQGASMDFRSAGLICSSQEAGFPRRADSLANVAFTPSFFGSSSAAILTRS